MPADRAPRSDEPTREPPKPYYQDEFVTLYHGDCHEILPSLRGDAVVTDPPYGVGVKYGSRYDDRRKDYWDWMRSGVVAMRQAAPVVAFTHRVAALRELSGWDWVAVWHKPGSFGARIGNSPVLPHWEPIFLYGIHSIGTSTGAVLHDVLSINPEPARAQNMGMGRTKWGADGNGKHPCPKPPDLMARLVTALTTEGAVVIDPFAGSGTTIRVAKDMGRKIVAIELEERWCEQAANRACQDVLDLGGAA